jgi:hypothetical protein
MAYVEDSGPKRLMWDCGVPIEECLASIVTHSGPQTRQYKAHANYESAVICAKKHADALTALGDGVYIPSKPQAIKGGKAKRCMIPNIRG